METINNFLLEGLKDFRAAIEQGQQAARNYETKTDFSYNPTNARFKLVVWFKNGKTRWYYSFDNVHTLNQVHVDEWSGIKKLIRLAEIKLKGQFKNAIIYANLDQNKKVNDPYNYEVIKWNYNGDLKQTKFINFSKSKDTKSIYFDCERLKTFGSQKIS